MPIYTCSCGGCKGKSVSRSTFYGHSERRLQESVVALQAQDAILLPEDTCEEEFGTVGGNNPYMG
jgi:hypothetical protein